MHLCVFMLCPVWPLKAWFIHVPPPFSCPAPSGHCAVVFSLAEPQWIPWGPSVCVCVCLFICFACANKRARENEGIFGTFYECVCVFELVNECVGFLSVCVCLGCLCSDPQSPLWLCVVSADLNNNERGNAGCVLDHPKWIEFFSLTHCSQSRCAVACPEGLFVPNMIEASLLWI